MNICKSVRLILSAEKSLDELRDLWQIACEKGKKETKKRRSQNWRAITTLWLLWVKVSMRIDAPRGCVFKWYSPGPSEQEGNESQFDYHKSNSSNIVIEQEHSLAKEKAMVLMATDQPWTGLISLSDIARDFQVQKAKRRTGKTKQTFAKGSGGPERET